MKKIAGFITITILLIGTCAVRAGEVPAAPEPAAKIEPMPVKAVSPAKASLIVKAVMAPALTLPECYMLALKQSETIAITADQVAETEAYFLQALSQVMPYVSFLSTDQQQEDQKNLGGSATGSTFQSLKPAKYSERKFYIKQTLFNGFKAIAAIKGSKFMKNQRIDEKARAEQLLLVDVSNAFYLLKEVRDDLKVLEKIREALITRVKELKARENLGRSRPSEVVNAKAQLYTVESSIEVVKSQTVVVRQLLEFLTGVPIDEIIDSYPMPETLKPEYYYVAKSDSRPDVKAAKYAWQVAIEKARAVDSDFLPNVSWEGNYYTQRTGFNEGVDWDVVLKFEVPIFKGTEALGNSKEYRLKAHESELFFKRTRRKAPFDIKDAHVKLSTALSVQEALKKAYRTARLNYYLQRKDYERSLVNNLDVLASIQTLQNSERDFIHAFYEAKRLYWQLRVAVGEGIAENLYDII